jgi:hypothetical protein
VLPKLPKGEDEDFATEIGKTAWLKQPRLNRPEFPAASDSAATHEAGFHGLASQTTLTVPPRSAPAPTIPVYRTIDETTRIGRIFAAPLK